MPESDLSAPVKRFLESQGFRPKSEIQGCDIVAVGEDGHLVVIELKQSLNLELILQAVDRLSMADEVWIAVPMTRKGRDRDPRARRLCRLLGIGLLTVSLKSGKVEPEIPPGPYAPRHDKRWRARLTSEYERRKGDPMEGGVNKRRIMTAYRQTCLALAEALAETAQRPRDLAHISKDAGAILRRNVYAWFARPSPGHYELTRLGQQELAQFRALSEPSPKPGG